MTDTTTTTTGTAMPDALSGYPVIGEIATTTTAMRAAADLLEAAGIDGLSVNCTDELITVHVTEDLADDAGRAGMVARLAAEIGATAVRATSAATGTAWVRADAGVGGLRVHIFTPIDAQHAADEQATTEATP